MNVGKNYKTTTLYYALKNKYYILLTSITILLGGALSLYHRDLTRIAINRMEEGVEYYNQVLFYAILSVVMRIFTGVIIYLSHWFKLKFKQNINYLVKRDVVQHLTKIPYNIFNKFDVGETVTILLNDVEGVSQIIEDIIVNIGFLSFTYIGSIILVFKIDWKIGLFSFLIIDPLVYISTKYFAPKLNETVQFERTTRADLTNCISEIIQGILSIKIDNLGKYFLSLFSNKVLVNNKANVKQFKVTTIASFANGYLPELSTAAILIYGGLRVAKGELSAGDIWALMSYTTMVHGRLNRLTNTILNIEKSKVRIEKITHLLNIKPETSGKYKYITQNTPGVEFKNISFKYEEQSKNILKNISFTIKPGEIIAIVGESGEGKSTLAKLLTRLYDINEGKILINNNEIEKWDLGNLRDNIAYISLDTYIFNTSVINNLKLNQQDVSKKDIEKYAQICCAHDYLKNLPYGYNTIIGKGGNELSSGQLQRIALIRALIRNPQIIILDEATSAIDIHTEKRILNSIIKNFKGSTIIIIAHRTSTIEFANKFFYLENQTIKNINKKQVTQILNK